MTVNPQEIPMETALAIAGVGATNLPRFLGFGAPQGG